jgi:hypothetical protein
MIEPFNHFRRLLIASSLIGSLFLLPSCVTSGSQNLNDSAGPDRIEVAKRAEVQGELQKVFGPIDKESELLQD